VSVRITWLLAVLSVLTATHLAAMSGIMGAPAAAEVDSLLQSLKFTAPEIASVRSGTVIAHADSVDGGELATYAAVRVAVPHAQVVSYYGQMVAYVDGKVTLGFGRFSNPATAGDVARLAFDRKEVDAIRACRPAKCDIRLGGTAIAALHSTIDWTASDYVDRVNAFARKAAVDYVNAYRARGDDALITFDDSDKPVSLKAAWTGMLANAPVLRGLHPQLVQYLTAYPKDPLTGARDIIYWIKEDYGMKPVISVVHAVVDSSGGPDRTVVVQKYIYASHYYDASVAVASIMTRAENGAPATYIVYGNRSRGDLLRGGFGGMGGRVARSQARKAAEQTLATIKDVLENTARQ
jgi:hypothetical protein